LHLAKSIYPRKNSPEAAKNIFLGFSNYFAVMEDTLRANSRSFVDKFLIFRVLYA